MKTFLAAFRLLTAFTLLLGLLYPLAVWAIGRAFWRTEAEGSLLYHNSRLIGSTLLAQKIDDPRYFQARPSAGDYATVASGASNQAWSSAKLAAAVAERGTAWGAAAPADLLTTSGSGLDPDLSVEAARYQVDRIVTVRHLTADQRHALDDLIATRTNGGHLSPARINVLELNLALDAVFAKP